VPVPHPSASEPVGGFYEIHLGGHFIVGDMDTIIFNAVVDVHTFEFDVKLAPFNVGP
jgi:hypothetical protein